MEGRQQIESEDDMDLAGQQVTIKLSTVDVHELALTVPSKIIRETAMGTFLAKKCQHNDNDCIDLSPLGIDCRQANEYVNCLTGSTPCIESYLTACPNDIEAFLAISDFTNEEKVQDAVVDFCSSYLSQTLQVRFRYKRKFVRRLWYKPLEAVDERRNISFYKRLHKFITLCPDLAQAIFKLICKDTDFKHELITYCHIPQKRQAAWLKCQSMSDLTKYCELLRKRMHMSF